jgi:hypothetical protein
MQKKLWQCESLALWFITLVLIILLGSGLANRVVVKGKSREVAEELASQIASFPQVST